MVLAKLDPGYERAIAAVKRLQGIDRGAPSWLAVQLGTTRQGLYYWSKVGFPDEKLLDVAKITKLPVAELASSAPLTIKIPRPVWEAIRKMVPKSMTNQATIL